jgi:hypothetical protein
LERTSSQAHDALSNRDKNTKCVVKDIKRFLPSHQRVCYSATASFVAETTTDVLTPFNGEISCLGSLKLATLRVPELSRSLTMRSLRDPASTPSISGSIYIFPIDAANLSRPRMTSSQDGHLVTVEQPSQTSCPHGRRVMTANSYSQ